MKTLLKPKKKRTFVVIAILVLVLCSLIPAYAAGGDSAAYTSPQYATFWALVPPIIAITLALLTKEVYFSLFLGIIAGALLYANFDPILATTSIVDTLTGKLSDSWNVGILIFLVALGIMVSLMNKAGGSAAYGNWASRRIKTPRGALFSTFGLGALIFVDDYFNCLTVGSVMAPVTDKHRISRAKLAYIIDATAAPVCIIAPISSWAAAVTSSAVGDVDGFSLFLQSIPYNFYALLTIVMVITTVAMKVDFGPMKKYETLAKRGQLFGENGNEYSAENASSNPKGKVIDLVLPVLVLIACCVIGMVYTGGFFAGESFINAFAQSDASVGLALGSIVAILFTFLLYIPRRVLRFREFAACLPEGFKQMVPAILILSFAWTLSGFCSDRLGAGEFVGNVVYGNAAANIMLPAILFLIALGLAFATGTSWGTFAILIPIAQAIFPDSTSNILIICISAILAGAVCGDHISPISDTTIMASTGAQVNHIAHVSTQMPYALLVGGFTLIGYVLVGIFGGLWYVVLPLCAALLILTLYVIKRRTKPIVPEKPAIKADIRKQ